MPDLFLYSAQSVETLAPLLRDYQVDVITRLDVEIAAGRRRLLLVAPTGSGKTVIGSAVIADRVAAGQRVLFWAHRRELVSQASRKLHDAGIDHGVIQAGHPTREDAPVQVASIQTLHARAVRSTRLDLPPADLLVIDEAHHARATTYQAVVDLYPEAIVVGMTATPCRGDGMGLGTIFQAIVECPSVQALIDQGHLVPTRVYAPSTPDLKGVKVRSGDYAVDQLETRMNTNVLVGDIVSHWHRLASGRRTVVFATGIGHSVHIRDLFCESGVAAEHVDGNTPVEERDAILARLRSGVIRVVSNCMVLTEGWDQPEVSCLVLARPTKSMGLYRQMIGRVLRPAPGKDHALILDHSGAVFQHGFVEDPVEWVLSDQDKARNRKDEERKAEPTRKGLTTCPECQAIRQAGSPCGACGWAPKPKAVAVDFVDGELAQVDRYGRVTNAAADHTRWYGELVGLYHERNTIRRQRGQPELKPGWVGALFREKFGGWPPGRIWPPPRPVSPEIRAWVRSRDIAYAKSRAAS